MEPNFYNSRLHKMAPERKHQYKVIEVASTLIIQSQHRQTYNGIKISRY